MKGLSPGSVTLGLLAAATLLALHHAADALWAPAEVGTGVALALLTLGVGAYVLSGGSSVSRPALHAAPSAPRPPAPGLAAGDRREVASALHEAPRRAEVRGRTSDVRECV